MNKKYISIICYIISVLLIIFYVILDFISNINLSELGRLSILCTSSFFLYFGGFFLSKYLKTNKPMKINLWIFFTLYLILLITLTLFDPMWGRNGISFVSWSKKLLRTYINNSVNIIPFHTITSYISKFNSLYDTKTIILNLFGNIIALMPMALFLPLLFKKQQKIKSFLITIILIVLGIEFTQFITLSGSCDIDDLILNVFGALIMYIILNVKSVKNIIRNIFLLEKNKVSKKSIIKIILSVIIIISGVIILVLYRKKLYNRNYEEAMKYINYEVKIIDDNKDCDNNKEKFYEDEYYIYYFKCIKSDKVYAVINNEEKYLVKDLLNNNQTKYEINIDRLKNAGLEYERKSKYEELKIKGKGNVYSSVEIENDNILQLEHGIIDSVLDETYPEKTKFEEHFFIIPKKEETTTIKIKYLDNETKKLSFTKKYNIIIDKNLNVTYKELSNK